MRRLRQALSEESGQSTISAMIMIPALLLIGGLVLVGGRLALASGAVQSAANEAARAASISRTAPIAQGQATSTAQSTLNNSGVKCSRTSVEPALGAFTLPVGQSGPITVTVTCVVPLADLALPGIPGSKTMTATGTSVLDAYRGRS